METPCKATVSFHKDIKVKESYTLHPGARMVFSSYHLGGCNHCSFNENDTLEQVCKGYGIPLEEFLGELNKLLL